MRPVIPEDGGRDNARRTNLMELAGGLHLHTIKAFEFEKLGAVSHRFLMPNLCQLCKEYL
jgi:hypothetical protein